MGRRPSPADMAHRGSVSGPRAWLVHVCLAALLAGATTAAGAARAATLSERIAQKSQPQAGKPADRMLVNADELVYDRTKNTVTANGNVQVYYQGRILQADHVVYDRNADRVYAEGHAKLTDQDGTVTYADRFDLTDDFKNGFIESLRADTVDKTHFTAPRAERSEGETTVFEDGTYTACQPCKDHPDRPPLWQLRAKRIIHKNDEQMIYFEDADLEFLGIPIAYIPYLSVPDPSVKQRSGVLAPHYYTKTALGFGVGIPIYWALAPDYDLTVTPTYFTRQGLLGSVEWRQKFINGSYNIRASGIFEQDPAAFLPPPYGSADERSRGSIESNGEFLINDKWKFGWNVTVLSDKWFLSDYSLQDQTLSSNFFKESTSTIYLTGQAGRGYFDLRGYYFQGLAQNDLQSQQPVVAPVLDYHRTFDIKPEQSYGIGGQIEVDANLTHLAQDLASFQSTGTLQLDNAYSLYNVCTPPQVAERNAQSGGPLLSERLRAAGHRRRIYACDRQRVVAAQIHRPDRRSMESLRFRASERRKSQPRHDHERNFHEHVRDVDDLQCFASQFHRPKFGDDRRGHARRRYRISLPVHRHDGRAGTGVRTDRAGDRAARRAHQ